MRIVLIKQVIWLLPAYLSTVFRSSNSLGKIVLKSHLHMSPGFPLVAVITQCLPLPLCNLGSCLALSQTTEPLSIVLSTVAGSRSPRFHTGFFSALIAITEN